MTYSADHNWDKVKEKELYRWKNKHTNIQINLNVVLWNYKQMLKYKGVIIELSWSMIECFIIATKQCNVCCKLRLGTPLKLEYIIRQGVYYES